MSEDRSKPPPGYEIEEYEPGLWQWWGRGSGGGGIESYERALAESWWDYDYEMGVIR